MRYIQSMLFAIVAFEAVIGAPTDCKDLNLPLGVIPYRCDIDKRSVGLDRRGEAYDYDARPDSPTIPKRALERREYDNDCRPDSPTIGKCALARRQYDYDARPDSPTIP
jgi:hypothetical protein